MKPQTILILFSFTVLALALIPLASAQEGNMLTDTLSSWGESLSGFGSQASEYVTTHVPETTAITGGVAGTGICAGGWKFASKAKNAFKSQVNNLTSQVSVYEGKAASAQEQLSKLQTDASTQIGAYKTQAENATQQLGGIQDKLTSVTQQKASLQNQVDELQSRLKTAQDQLAVLTPKVK
jgi:uncharacterized protein HemX